MKDCEEAADGSAGETAENDKGDKDCEVPEDDKDGDNDEDGKSEEEQNESSKENSVEEESASPDEKSPPQKVAEPEKAKEEANQTEPPTESFDEEIQEAQNENEDEQEDDADPNKKAKRKFSVKKCKFFNCDKISFSEEVKDGLSSPALSFVLVFGGSSGNRVVTLLHVVLELFHDTKSPRVSLLLTQNVRVSPAKKIQASLVNLSIEKDNDEN